MVFLTVVLFMVSVLAIHINNAASAEHPVVHHACEGETFCHIKPENYPQEEIDQFVIRNLPHLHRMKRSIINPTLTTAATARPGPGGNCAVKEITPKKPFTLQPNATVPKLVLQSKWFEQFVPRVICSNVDAPCFNSFTLGIPGVRTRCVTKELSSTVVIYDQATNKAEHVSTNIEVDCGCMVEHTSPN